MQNAKCKICRRLGQKLFLKGDKCLSQKCPMLSRPYPPGQKKKRRKSLLSEYGRQLQEKQKIKITYGLTERQFNRYAKESLRKSSLNKKSFAEILIEKLESRLDNIILRAGFANSRFLARQLVSHGHFLVNNKKVNFPSFQVEKGDIISLRDKSKKMAIFKDLPIILKKYQLPSWLQVDRENFQIKVINLPSSGDVSLPGDLQKIGEFYSR